MPNAQTHNSNPNPIEGASLIMHYALCIMHYFQALFNISSSVALWPQLSAGIWA
jgi:hypothetical protein